ncbi:Calx-beta domain-containing protein [Candidatus Leptofilum sp.]|uniref:Calx-beta domain-containing protein n=1 Tax=Candidatus Leptofilum sp. TaxID=3241576 RepID=UPI003B5CD2C6
MKNKNVVTFALAIAIVFLILPALFAILSKAQIAHAATFTVNIFTDQDDGICDMASCSLREAIDQAGNGDDITIPAGTYTLASTLVVTENLTFNGNSSADTFIDAQGNGQVFNVTGGTVVFNDLTIQNGIDVNGGGIHISGATTNVTLNSSSVFSNSATTNGGGIYLQSGALALQNSEVVTNTAVADGGGVYTLRGSITIDNSNVNYNVSDRAGGIFVNQTSANLTLNSGEISFNVANTVTDSFHGGGIFIGAGSATINNGEIRNNLAFRGGGILVSGGSVTINGGQIIDNESNYGGGVYVREESGLLTINGGEITQNRSIASIFGGGGLYIFQGHIIMNGGEVSANTAVNDGGALEIGDALGRFSLNDGEIYSNSAGNMGGGIYAAEGTLAINGGTIHTNNSIADGGGIATGIGSQTTIQNAALLTNTATITSSGGAIKNGGILTMTNVTLSGNEAGSGAGLANTDTAVLTNVTLSENTANTSGGGLSNSGGGTLTVGNSIIFGNTGGAECSGSITSAGNNINNCGLAGSGDSGSDPLLQPLALNGGDTLNYALGALSPAIDNGNNATCPATDQRGNLRPVGGVCDSGAYEDGIGFFISDVTMAEGDVGNTQMIFTVSRSFITDTTYTVDYETFADTALASMDYTAISDTLEFLPSDMTKTVIVDILGDTLDEDDETFNVTLSNPSGASQLGDDTGTGTILDDDAPPSLTIGDVTVGEGGTAVFTVILSAESGKTIMVDWATVDGTAVASTDYTADSGTLTFAPGDDEETISISVTGDSLDEFDEAFTVELSNESNVTLADSSGEATITDDDLPPGLSIVDVTVSEGDSGTITANFVVNLTAASGKTITVNYQTADVSATAGSDYLAASDTLTINPGSTSQIIGITVNGDTVSEDDETFHITLSTPSNATIDDGTAVGTITDDDDNDGFVIFLPLVLKP